MKRSFLSKKLYNLKCRFTTIKKCFTYGPRYYFDKKYRHKIKKKLGEKRRKLNLSSKFIYRKKEIKDNLILRRGRKCEWCFKRFPKEMLTIDHILDVSMGGDSNYDNLQLLCIECHETKTKMRHKGILTIKT